MGYDAGTHKVGDDIAPGLYVGKAGIDSLDSCYWARLSGASGDFDDLLANENAIGQFYIDVQPSDEYLQVNCFVMHIDDWPVPAQPLTVLEPGTYIVGRDIIPGIYAGRTGTNAFDSCYWARLSGASGDFDDLLANENAIGQFYIDVRPSDKYLQVSCPVTHIDEWPVPTQPLTVLEPGTYIVGRDIVQGTYRGKAGTGTLDSCYWARLSGASGDFDDLLANENAKGSFYITVAESDFALTTGCDLELTE